MTEHVRALVLNWVAAINDKNLDKLIACYDEQAVHYSPKLKQLHPESQGRVEGHVALRAWYADAMQRLPKLHYEVVRTTVEKEAVFLEYIRHNPGDEPMQVGEFFQVKEGRIHASRVYHS